MNVLIIIVSAYNSGSIELVKWLIDNNCNQELNIS